jgi:protein-S-isoprenylcysteine O-methyltransferase Ste14
MNRRTSETLLLFFLALLFSAGLMYAFMALPEWLDGLVQNNIHTPGGDPAWDSQIKFDTFLDAYAIKTIGIICLCVVLLLIVIGFSTRKLGFAWTGAIVLFLPVFGTFAASMFYLAGLGLFNTLLFPFMDISLEIMKLGSVVMIPYWLLMEFFGLFNWYAHNFLMYFFMATGAFIFVFSVFTWFQTYYRKQKVASGWLYRISRHPQYLGWIIWSYGLMLYGPTVSNMRKSWGWNGTLSWLLSTMVIIGICLLEEKKMQEKAGHEYDDYRDRTPFLFPIPLWLKIIIKWPMILIIRKSRPTKNREVAGSILIYTLIFMALSLFWIDFGSANESRPISKQPTEQTIDSLLTEIHKPQNRRYRKDPVWQLGSLGSIAEPYIANLIADPDDVLREFSLDITGEFSFRSLLPEVINSLGDSNGRVRRSALIALEKFKAYEARDTLLSLLYSSEDQINDYDLVSVLGSLGVKEIKPWLLKKLESPEWYMRSSALAELYRIDTSGAWEYIYQALEDTSYHVRRASVMLILDHLPSDAPEYLSNILNDEDWEVRFYGRQALKKIKESPN